MRRALAAILIVLILAVGVVLFRTLRPDPPPSADELLADTIRMLRTAAESCRNDLNLGTARLHAYDRKLDSMRARVRGFERMHPRGVPADSYAVYLEAFEQYNDSVEGWDARTDSLQARLQRCRDVTERHNTLADSLRRMLIEQQPDLSGS